MPSAPTRSRPAPLAAATLLLLVIATSGGCAVESGYTGACVEDSAENECRPSRAGRCDAHARFVEDESCEALGFTYACGAQHEPASEQGGTWVRSASACTK